MDRSGGLIIGTDIAAAADIELISARNNGAHIVRISPISSDPWTPWIESGEWARFVLGFSHI